ncbi:LacI family DNA-binding transcriptional regulator [Paracoccus sediminilitoris]|uniref:LacI family DNA-binding transcriptional regulator n=1 Tax=Paracoccus sediminilitoris TaxID=2202419 RepID=UPI000DBA222E|nr:LacI family DNA-binding transcriptional regulator [Paracoccus sediminilitoris]
MNQEGETQTSVNRGSAAEEGAVVTPRRFQGPTLRDIATAAGVSVAAVSKALNQREGVSARSRQRVLKAAEELGYLDRSGKGQSGQVSCAALITLGRMVSNDAFYHEIVEGILQQAEAKGIKIIVQMVNEDPQRHTPDLPAEADAVIMMGIDYPQLLTKVTASGLPAVIVNGMDRRMLIPSVSPDYHFGGWAATRHLIDLGHRDIVHVTHVYRESIRRRLEGFCDALAEAGIVYDPDNHLLDLGSPARFGIEARGMVETFLSQRRHLPSAFVCVSDAVALGTLQAIQARGLSVPGDISLIGFDGLPVGAHSSPSLSSMQIDRRHLGITAIDTLIDFATNGGPARRIGIGVELIVRESSGTAER